MWVQTFSTLEFMSLHTTQDTPHHRLLNFVALIFWQPTENKVYFEIFSSFLSLQTGIKDKRNIDNASILQNQTRSILKFLKFTCWQAYNRMH